jgi:monoamine oxidase
MNTTVRTPGCAWSACVRRGQPRVAQPRAAATDVHGREVVARIDLGREARQQRAKRHGTGGNQMGKDSLQRGQSSALARRREERQTMTHIAIVGGGPSGLMTARLLEQTLGNSCRLTLLEASHRLGGKIQTRRFDTAPVVYESGVAECYAYAPDHDPLRQLIAELGLTAVPTGSSAVVLNGVCLDEEREIGTHFGADALSAVEDFRRRTVAMLPLASWHHGFGPGDNGHPWASRTCADVLEEVPNPIARHYLKIMAHSDMATEPHLASGLVGLRNFLKSVPGYGAQYSIEGGMEMLPRRLAASLMRTAVELDAPVVRVSRSRDSRYIVTTRRARRFEQSAFDAIVVALPYNRLQEIEWMGERLRRAMGRHVACYDHAGHYLRISILFDRRFWRHLFTGSWVMLDAFGGCCVYDETPSGGNGTYGVLGWLLGGADALAACNSDDRTLIARALGSLPDELYDEARWRVIEGKVHRWAGAVSGQPGGNPLRDVTLAHRPEPVEHPGLVMVGDYLFDSTLNGVLRSARIATDLLRGPLSASSPLELARRPECLTTLRASS